MNQYDTMTITEEQAKRYKFPAKASDGKEVVIVRSRTVDISDNVDDPKIEKTPEENVKMDDPASDNDWRSLNIGTRKFRWIAQLIEKMKSEPFTGQFAECPKLGQ